MARVKSYTVLALLLCFVGITVQATDKAKAGDKEEEEALSIVAKHCAGCHQAADHPGRLFLNRARFNEPDTVRLLIKTLEAGQMPKGHSQFKNSPEGTKLLTWLRRQLPKGK